MLRKSKTATRYKGGRMKKRGKLFTKPRFSRQVSKNELVMKMSLVSNESSHISKNDEISQHRQKKKNSKNLNSEPSILDKESINLNNSKKNKRCKTSISRQRHTTTTQNFLEKKKKTAYPKLKRLASQRSKSTQASNSSQIRPGFGSSQPKYPEKKIFKREEDYEKFMQNLHRMMPDPGQYEVTKKIDWKKPSISKRGIYGLAAREGRFRKKKRLETPGPGKYGYGEEGKGGIKREFGDVEKTVDFSKRLGREGDVYGFGNGLGEGFLGADEKGSNAGMKRVRSAVVRKREIKSKAICEFKFIFLRSNLNQVNYLKFEFNYFFSRKNANEIETRSRPI